MVEILYKYCYDENDELIHISEVTKENRKAHEYKCISCGREMRVWLQGNGERSRRSHFGHKANCSCNSETYLHKLAKIKIREQFYLGHELMLCLQDDKTNCSESNHCKMYNPEMCKNVQKRFFNLCDYYDTCEEEASVDDYIADLKLTKSDMPNRPPLLIEIFVSHRCEEEKWNSYKILETAKIVSEKQIEEIVEKGFIAEINHNYVNPRTYDFDETIIPPTANCRASKNIIFNINGRNTNPEIFRFILHPNLDYEIREINCSQKEVSLEEDSIVELNVNPYHTVMMEQRMYHEPDKLALMYLWRKIGCFSSCRLCSLMYSELGCWEEKAFKKHLFTHHVSMDVFERRLDEAFHRKMYYSHLNDNYCRNFVYKPFNGDVPLSELDKRIEAVKIGELPKSILKPEN